MSFGRWGPEFREKVVLCGAGEIGQDRQDIDPFELLSTVQPGAVSPNEAKRQVDDHGAGVPIADDRDGAQNPESGRDLFKVRLISGETKHDHHSENAEN